jgi:hypothetical protein
MQPLLPEKLSRNGTGATSPAQATDKAVHGRLAARGKRLPAFPWAVLFANLLPLVDGPPAADRSSL